MVTETYDKQQSDLLLHELLTSSDLGTIITIDDLATRYRSVAQFLYIVSYTIARCNLYPIRETTIVKY